MNLMFVNYSLITIINSYVYYFVLIIFSTNHNEKYFNRNIILINIEQFTKKCSYYTKLFSIKLTKSEGTFT